MSWRYPRAQAAWAVAMLVGHRGAVSLFVLPRTVPLQLIRANATILASSRHHHAWRRVRTLNVARGGAAWRRIAARVAAPSRSKPLYSPWWRYAVWRRIPLAYARLLPSSTSLSWRESELAALGLARRWLPRTGRYAMCGSRMPVMTAPPLVSSNLARRSSISILCRLIIVSPHT